MPNPLVSTLRTPTGRVLSEHKKRRDGHKTAAPGERVCEVDGCEDKHYSRGWCSRHYFRWYRYGSAEAATRTPEQERERILDLLNERAPLDEETGCWLWQGAISRGSPVIKIAGTEGDVRFEAHRLSYLLLVGPIPEGTRFRRSCSERCINPEHLEEVHRSDDPWVARMGDVVPSTWKLVLANLDFTRKTVRSAVWTHFPRMYSEMDEWQQYGLLGLIEAASRKPDLGEVQFRWYARRLIKTAMAQGFREMTGRPRHSTATGYVPPVSLDVLTDDFGWEFAA